MQENEDNVVQIELLGMLITLSNFKFFIYKYDEEVVVSNC